MKVVLCRFGRGLVGSRKGACARVFVLGREILWEGCNCWLVVQGVRCGGWCWKEGR